MKLGYIQQLVLSHIKKYEGCRFRLHSQATLMAREFSAFDFAQVERAVAALVKRHIIRQDGTFYQLEQFSDSTR